MNESKRAIQKKATREKILLVATDQFATYGFLVTTTDIAKKAGLSHGSLFVHFPTREELMGVVIQNFFENLNRQLHLAVKGQKNLKDVLNKHLDVIQENEPFYKSLVTDLAFLPAHAQEKLFACQSTLSYHFQLVLEKEQGRIKNMPPYMLFNMWIAIIHYYLTNSRMFQPEGSLIKQYRQELLNNYLKLIERVEE